MPEQNSQILFHSCLDSSINNPLALGQFLWLKVYIDQLERQRWSRYCFPINFVNRNLKKSNYLILHCKSKHLFVQKTMTKKVQKFIQSRKISFENQISIVIFFSRYPILQRDIVFMVRRRTPSLTRLHSSFSVKGSAAPDNRDSNGPVLNICLCLLAFFLSSFIIYVMSQ